MSRTRRMQWHAGGRRPNEAQGPQGGAQGSALRCQTARAQGPGLGGPALGPGRQESVS